MTQLHRREWKNTTRDKTRWGIGAWQNEPDKIQWVDEASDLDCMIVRGPLGALCGYVGVAEGHPLFSKDYDAADVEVHGGLTFSDFCHEATREAWEKWRERMRASETEAQRYPNGDSARRLKEIGHLIDNYDGWREYGESQFICHVPIEGRPAHVWWLGFDCSHYHDVTPGMNEFGDRDQEGWYKDVEYVTQQVTHLAAQLRQLAA